MAALEQGVEVPHFCWHGALGSAGACRICAITLPIGPGRPGRIETACAVCEAGGARLHLQDLEGAVCPALGHDHDPDDLHA